MSNLLERVTKTGIDRREFLKGSLVATAALGLTGTLAGCDTKVSPTQDTQPADMDSGKWITAGCNYDCGGRCLNKAYVVDGVVVRQKTDDTHPDDPLFLQQRACPRGRSHRNMIYSADKLRYPMKRKNWEPLTGGDKSLRGIDEWVRISWDEAIELVVTELENAKEKWGNDSIFYQAIYADPVTGIDNVMCRFGGYVGGWTPASFGSWVSCTTCGLDLMNACVNDRYDLQNCDTVILFANNPAWGAAGNMFYYYEQIKKAGAQFYTIDPMYTDTAAALDATWLPVRPGTDSALCLAVIHTLITEDDPATNPLIDWDFLRKYSIGFDETMMPAGADPQHNLKNYVMGGLDGVEKTPEWASRICGLEPEKIKGLAYALDKNKKVAIISGYANGRNVNVESLPQLILALGLMTGHIGKSGHSTGQAVHRMGINTGPFPYAVAGTGMPTYNPSLMVTSVSDPQTYESPVKSFLHLSESWDAILDGEAFVSTAPTAPFAPQTKKKVDIHVLANFLGNTLDVAEGGMKGIEAFRKVDFVWAVAIYPSSYALYADIIMPKVSFWEEEGFISSIGTRDAIIACQKVIEPLYEAKPKNEIGKLLCQRMFTEKDVDELFPYDDKELYFNMLKRTQVTEADGTTVPLCTITEDDLTEWGVEGDTQQGKIELSELMDKGVYKFDIKPGDGYSFIAFKDFIADPVAHPLNTASGKFELYCQAHADLVNGLGWSTIDPLPMYETGPERYEDSFSDWDNQVKGDYPFQVYSAHYMGHAHTNFSNNSWAQEAFTSPAYINAQDAAALGIKEGDGVLLTSQHGKIARPAAVTNRIIPGVIAIPHGCWKDIDEETGIDMGGNDNTLGDAPISGAGVAAFNTMLARAEKFNTPLTPDYLKPRRVLIEE